MARAGTGLTGFLQNLTGGEMVIIALVALLVLGPDRLPEMARGAGRMLHKLRTMTEGVQNEVRDVMADPSMQPLKELGELAARPRQKLTEYALEAEAEERAKREAAHAAATEAAAASDPGTDTPGADSAGTDTSGADSPDTDTPDEIAPETDTGAAAHTDVATSPPAEQPAGGGVLDSGTQEPDRT